MSSESALRDGNSAEFELIETLRWEPSTGFVRLERHLARLQSSAQALGFRHVPDAIERALGDASKGTSPLRIRLTLARKGEARASAHVFTPVPPGTVWRLGIAHARLDARDPFIRHKTSRRDIYQAARAEFTPAEVDEVLLLNLDGQICEGTITNLFIDDGDGGPLLTPALDCGLLPGILRGELIDQGRAREAKLMPADLAAAKTIYVGNSLRGMIPAIIV